MAKDNKYGQIDVPRIKDEDEPIFIFRATDILASYPLRVYKELMISIGNKEGADSVDLAIKRFEAWTYRRMPT